MHTESSIIITKVANGFIVTLPENQEQSNPFAQVLNPTVMDKMSKVIKNTIQGEDDVLMRLQDQIAEEAELSEKSLQPPVEKFQLVFKTFTGVLAFLNQYHEGELTAAQLHKVGS